MPLVSRPPRLLVDTPEASVTPAGRLSVKVLVGVPVRATSLVLMRREHQRAGAALVMVSGRNTLSMAMLRSTVNVAAGLLLLVTPCALVSVLTGMLLIRLPSWTPVTCTDRTQLEPVVIDAPDRW